MCFAGCGVWHPDGATLGKIRDAVVERPEEWTRITASDAFCQTFHLAGEALKRPPRGYDPEHPLIEDLKRKDFVAITDIPEAEAIRPDFLDRFAAMARAGGELTAFLCRAVGVPF